MNIIRKKKIEYEYKPGAKCCKDMSNALKDCLLWHRDTGINITSSSRDGHIQSMEIKHCPFCGERIQVKQ